MFELNHRPDAPPGVASLALLTFDLRHKAPHQCVTSESVISVSHMTQVEQEEDTVI